MFLDLLRPDGYYDLEAFRIAFAVQIPILLLGITGMLVSRRRLRRRMAARGELVPPWREVFRDGRWSRTPPARADRKSTRLNSSHVAISYAVFCLKKKITRPEL